MNVLLGDCLIKFLENQTDRQVPWAKTTVSHNIGFCITYCATVVPSQVSVIYRDLLLRILVEFHRILILKLGFPRDLLLGQNTLQLFLVGAGVGDAASIPPGRSRSGFFRGTAAVVSVSHIGRITVGVEFTVFIDQGSRERRRTRRRIVCLLIGGRRRRRHPSSLFLGFLYELNIDDTAQWSGV